MTAPRTPGPGAVTGFAVGKFLPTHLGHVHLLRQAMARCDHLDVFAVWRPEEPIPGHLRAQWLREEVPGAVVHEVLDDLGPDDPAGWAANVRKVLGRSPDLVFTSEPYGDRFAAELDARHVAVDPERLAVPVSGTAVRTDPYACWPLLPSGARAWFTLRVAVVGAESTGGTTISQALADHYRTEWVPEVGRAWTADKDAAGTLDRWDTPEFVAIARQQQADEDAAARRAGPVLVGDTDALATGIWHERYVGGRCEVVEQLAAERPYDLYLLTGDEIPWEDDGTRDGEHLRSWMTGRFREELARRPEPVVELTGPPEARLAAATAAIDAVLAQPWTERHRIRATQAHRPQEVTP